MIKIFCRRYFLSIHFCKRYKQSILQKYFLNYIFFMEQTYPGFQIFFKSTNLASTLYTNLIGIIIYLSFFFSKHTRMLPWLHRATNEDGVRITFNWFKSIKASIPWGTYIARYISCQEKVGKKTWHENSFVWYAFLGGMDSPSRRCLHPYHLCLLKPFARANKG